MDRETKTRNEYEEQYFDFSSELFLEVSRKLLKDCCDSAVRSAKNLLTRQLMESASNPEVLEKAIEEFAESMTSEYGRGVEYGITSVEGKIKECLHIPDEVCLEEDITKQVEKVNEDELDAEIAKLRQEIKNVKVLCASMEDEMTIAEGTVSVLEDWDGVKVDTYMKGVNEV